jgi:hypothetical protein
VQQAVEATPIDYAAIAKDTSALEEAQESETSETPAEPAKAAEGEAPAKPTEAAKPAEPKAEEPAKSDLELNFEKLVRKQSEFRKEVDEAKPGIELTKVIGAPSAQALNKAIAMKDPLSALAAIGFSVKDVTNAFIGGEKPKAPVKPAEKPADAPAQSTLPPEVQEMLNEHKQMKATAQRQAVGNEIKRVVGEGKEKFPLLTNLEAFEEVNVVIEEMYSRGGFPQGASPQEVIRIAAEEAESRLGRQKAKWSKVLTPAAAGATVPPKAPETPKQPAQESGGQTNKPAAVPAGSPSHAGFDREAAIAELKNDPFLLK